MIFHRITVSAVEMLNPVNSIFLIVKSFVFYFPASSSCKYHFFQIPFRQFYVGYPAEAFCLVLALFISSFVFIFKYISLLLPCLPLPLHDWHNSLFLFLCIIPVFVLYHHRFLAIHSFHAVASDFLNEWKKWFVTIIKSTIPLSFSFRSLFSLFVIWKASYAKNFFLIF